ncbi:hypothetical protein IMCC3317_30020 [Kordia antarctica]|uniref:Uncharacterized protein n=1 Tax=Kordia antarctica TaxID=1218801 RepID=A0A7L4ZLU2_9FLAO|nr:class I lanthipeptide [Kordia antarctica]QHI37622.1 hypothetical protein IMCC3317_30020 [Kordia antarctica]
MKKKNLVKKLQLKKAQISNLSNAKVIGGFDAEPWSTKPRTCLTQNCTEFNTCPCITIATCLTDECITRSCNPDVCPDPF